MWGLGVIVHYRDMAADRVRVEAFRRGIAAAVRPGDVVVDVGCGLGTYAIFACRSGAKRVYAIDREDVILTAAAIARDNGCSDRIRFLRGDAFEVRLPEKADVVVTEDFCPMFVDPDTERLIARARTFLKPRGRFVPRSVSVFAAPVHAPKLYGSIDLWRGKGGAACGVDFSATRELAMNSVHRANLRPTALLGAPRGVRRVVLGRDGFAFQSAWRSRARKGGPVHGVAVWFDAELAGRVRLSNAPGRPPTLWGQGFLPLAEPVRVRKGGSIDLALAARFGRDSGRVWWQWAVTTGEGRADGTTFRSFPTSLADLEAGSRRHRPGLSVEGRIAECILRGLAAGDRIVDVASRLRRRFPGRFRSARDALARAGAEARKYGRRPQIPRREP